MSDLKPIRFFSVKNIATKTIVGVFMAMSLLPRWGRRRLLTADAKITLKQATGKGVFNIGP